jgi:hypothetical protein
LQRKFTKFLQTALQKFTNAYPENGGEFNKTDGLHLAKRTEKQANERNVG